MYKCPDQTAGNCAVNGNQLVVRPSQIYVLLQGSSYYGETPIFIYTHIFDETACATALSDGNESLRMDCGNMGINMKCFMLFNR